MLDFSINRLVIVSTSEGKARVIQFHKKITILTGGNDKGKSSLIKSILHCFGAEPPRDNVWRGAQTNTLVSFSVHGVDYSILRQGQTFTVFDAFEKIVGQFYSVTNELGPFLAKLFKFGLKLQKSSDGETITPPPAYYFLPFYFDQDQSWNKPWNSFVSLSQMTKWKSDLVEYHIGIKPNEFYEIKGEQAVIQKELERTRADFEIVKRIRDELSDKLHTLSFNVDLDAFREEITELIIECETIQKSADKIRDHLVGLHNGRILLEAQIEIVKNSLAELNKDYQFLKKSGDHVTCPLCSAEYDNTFYEKLEIALDEDKGEDLLAKLRDELAKIRAEINKKSTAHIKYESDAAKIRALLARKKEQVELKDLIENQSKKELKKVLQDKLEALNLIVLEADGKLAKLKRKLDGLTSKERKKEILDLYRNNLRRSFFKLSVPELTEKASKSLVPKIAYQGSDLPRALIAYGFSILNTMRQTTTGIYAPIIIDSPIQQDQDQENHTKILEFIRDNQPENTQLIMGVVDLKNVAFDGDIILLENEDRAVLLKQEFQLALSHIEPFIQKSLLFRERTENKLFLT
jgi:hypothetical protein